MSSPQFNLSTLVLSKEFAKKSVFWNGRSPIRVREHANMLKIVGFIQNDMGITYQGNPRYEHATTCKTEIQMMKSYHNNYVRENECYGTAHKLTKMCWGRTLPVDYLSLSVMHRPTRHALCDGIYADKDMVNAHVSILCEIFKNKPNIDISALLEYNSDPKRWRSELAVYHGIDPVKNKDDAKQLFIRMLFGGGYSQWIKDFDISRNILPSQGHPLILRIQNELSVIQEEFYNANPQMVKDLKKHDAVKFADVRQLKRSLLATALQTIERWIMEECIQFLTDEKRFDIRDIVPCQDGMMILKSLDYPGIEDDFERITLERFGMSVKWVDKPFDEAIDIPDGIIEKTLDEWNDFLTDFGISKLIIDTYGDRIRYKRPTEDSRDFLYIFDSVRKRWFSEEPKSPPTLLNMITSMYDGVASELANDDSLTDKELNRLSMRARTLLLSSAGNVGILKKLLCIAEWSDVEFDANPYLLGFENGYLDLRTGDFLEYSEDIHITLTTQYNYYKPDYVNCQRDIEIREDLITAFKGMFETDEDLFYVMQVLASGLDGINYQHIWFFQGVGGNGKSLGISLNEKVLGVRFCKAASGAILTADSQKANQSSEDVVLLKNGRTVVFNEMDKVEGMTWSSLKILTGGDTITARKMYKGLEQFKLNASVICAFNEKPDLIGNVVGPEKASLERRLRPIEFPYIFTDDEAKIALGGKYKRGNPMFVDKLWVEEAKHVYLDLLTGIYAESFVEGKSGIQFKEPAKIKEACNSYLKDADVFNEVFADLYHPSEEAKINKPKNRLFVGDLYDEILYHPTFKKGMTGEGKRAFGRTWNKKAFVSWCRGRFEVGVDARGGRDYILGFVRTGSNDLGYPESVGTEVETVEL